MRKGVVLMLVIIILIFMGAILFLLTDVSNKITFQTNRVFLETVEQNMISSGIAWAKHNIEKGGIKETENEIQFDTAGIGTRNAQLSVTIEKIAHKQAQVTVNTFCGLSSRGLKHTQKYQIALKH